MVPPRLRGNRFPARREPACNRSIPAPAGEPITRSTLSIFSRVYPRACGGTQLEYRVIAWCDGLSPRLRGNHRPDTARLPLERSIPAPAGEPDSRRPPMEHSRVYPRACGGTAFLQGANQRVIGLSPRLRGNRALGEIVPHDRRSIPAPAGEPVASEDRSSICTVYPRACGGTEYRRLAFAQTTGLSPRLRGNHPQGQRRDMDDRSIPAPAGELDYDAWRRKWVYPRACGASNSIVAWKHTCITLKLQCALSSI